MRLGITSLAPIPTRSQMRAENTRPTSELRQSLSLLMRLSLIRKERYINSSFNFQNIILVYTMKLISGHSSLCSIKPITTSKIGKLTVVCLLHTLEFYFFLKTIFFHS